MIPGGLSNGSIPSLVLGRVVTDRSSEVAPLLDCYRPRRASLPGESISGPLVQNATPLGKWSLQMDIQSSDRLRLESWQPTDAGKTCACRKMRFAPS